MWTEGVAVGVGLFLKDAVAGVGVPGPEGGGVVRGYVEELWGVVGLETVLVSLWKSGLVKRWDLPIRGGSRA